MQIAHETAPQFGFVPVSSCGELANGQVGIAPSMHQQEYFRWVYFAC